MGAISFKENAGMPDTLSSHRYELLFGNIPGGGDGAILRLRCQQAIIPGLDNETMMVTLHGFDYNFSGKNTFPKTAAFSFVEMAKTMPVHKALLTWQEFVRGTESGNSGGYKNDYAREVKMNVFDTVGTTVASFIFEKFYPQSVPDISMDGTSVTPMLVQATFAYDRFERSGVARK